MSFPKFEIAPTFRGVVPFLSNEDYHSCPALGSTQIKAASRSLAHFKAIALDKREEVTSSRQEAFDLGTCSHSFVLEQSTAPVLQGPDVSSKAVKEWKDFVAANPDKIILKPGEYRRVTELFDAFCDHPVAPRMVSESKVEQSYFFEDSETGLWLKARPDGYCQDDIKGNYIFDYKTTSRSSATANDFCRMAANLQYDVIAAQYIAGVEAVTGCMVQHYFWIIQELSAPYALSIFQASASMLKRGEEKRRALLNQISVAMKTGEFPGYDTSIIEIDLPSWATADNDPFAEAI